MVKLELALFYLSQGCIDSAYNTTKTYVKCLLFLLFVYFLLIGLLHCSSGISMRFVNNLLHLLFLIHYRDPSMC